ncbi:MAG: serine hydrolase domain-containing protein [Gemmatimonadaceae bacterium]
MRYFERALAAVVASCLTLQSADAQPSSDIIHGELARRADSLLSKAASEGFSAVILIAKGDTILLRHGYGWADRAQKIPFRPNTIFDVGSITKQFTAAGILALEAQGKLSLQDPISRYFPNAPADKANITLHQVMTHSAGFDDDFGPDYAVMSRDSLMGLVLAKPLKFEPGKEWSYSNAGYSMMATIIEKVSGVPYESFIHDRLFGRADMATTGYNIPHWDLTRFSRGYASNGDDRGAPLEKLWAADGPYWNLKGNGGILSTVDDMYRWHLALRNRSVLPESAMQKLERGYVIEDPKDTTTKYGYGWEHERTADGGRLMEHNGSSDHSYAIFRRYLDKDIVYIFATNSPRNACMPAKAATECGKTLDTERALRKLFFSEMP